MNVLKGIEPERPLYYLERISMIPRGSRNTKAVSDFCEEFAKAHSLKYVRDENNNIVIFKDAYPGYENSETVILQGHLDMVCEKEDGIDIDFEKDPLRLKVEDGFLFAEGTTLGADDGVAVAFMLAILEDPEIKAPMLECVFTVDEEIGMLGATAMDMSLLSGRRMINIDNEEEGVLLAGCAGGVTATGCLNVNREKIRGVRCVIEISKLAGGHSGTLIIDQGANANMLLGRILAKLSMDFKINVLRAEGGLKDNAIPRSSRAEIVVDETNLNAIKETVSACEQIFKSEYRNTDPELSMVIRTDEKPGEVNALDNDSTTRFIGVLNNLPNGIQKMSQKVKGLVQSSLNLGILKLEEEEATYSFSVRSDIGSEKEEMCLRMETLLKMAGGSMSYYGDYPGWEFNEKSYLQQVMKAAYTDVFGAEPVIGTVHAGLECGIFSDGLEGLDCVSIGPTMIGIHTPGEKLDLKSTERYWNYVLTVLDRLM